MVKKYIDWNDFLKRIFLDEELEYIKKNYRNKTYKEITNDINNFNKVKKDEKQVRTKASVMGLSKKKYFFNDRFFQNIDTEEKAYWLGFIYADGYIIKTKSNRDDGSGVSHEISIQLSYKDKKHLEKFNNSINGNFEIKKIKKKETKLNGKLIKSRYMSSIRIYSAKMFRDLNSINIFQNKTYREEFPIVDDFLFFHFLRGFMDGDGCIYFSKNIPYVKFTCANKKFLEFINNNIYKLSGIQGSIYTEFETKNNLVFTSMNTNKDLLRLIYKDSNIYLDRKYDLYRLAV